MKSRNVYILLIMAISFLAPAIASAQEWYVPPPPPDVVDTPIDGGISLLVAAGVGYGIKKVRDSRKKQIDK